MGAKSRGNWNIGYCLKDCANRSKKNCAECFRFSKFKEKAVVKLKPKSKGDCKRLLIQTAPPLDHKYGYFAETIEKWVELWNISCHEFWRTFGEGNTCTMDEKTCKAVFYPCDVERTIRECLNKKWVSLEEWD